MKDKTKPKFVEGGKNMTVKDKDKFAIQEGDKEVKLH